MTCRRILLILLALFVTAPFASAQVIISPYPPAYGYSGAYNLGYSRNYRHGSFGFSIGGLSSQGIVLAPGGILGAYPGPYAGGTTVIVTPPPTIQVAPRIVVDDLALEVLPREVLEAQGVKVPQRNAVPDQLPPPAPAKPAEIPRPATGVPEFRLPPGPVDDPRAEHARLVRLGRDAFAAGEDGRAADRFRQAVRLRPAEPTAHFLLAQALFALGKYPAAADAIRDGLDLRGDWPESAYRFKEAYEADLGAFAEQMHHLEEARDRFPDDPNVLFVLGYIDWFSDKRPEARIIFRKALAAGAERTSIERFLAVP